MKNEKYFNKKAEIIDVLDYIGNDLEYQMTSQEQLWKREKES